MSGTDARSRVGSDAVTAVQVRMGELAVGGADTTFRALLGSCVGVVLFDHEAGVAGMAHVVLPSSTSHDGPPGKFADTAVAELIQQLETLGGRHPRLRAKMAGGSRMFGTSAAVPIGDQNVEAVLAQLSSAGIPVTGSDCGGTSGRRMNFSVATGRAIIEAVGAARKEI